MADHMDAREVKKVIEASIFNPTMRRDAKDFVDAQEKVIETLDRHIMEIHRMPHEGHSQSGSYMECNHELCRAYVASGRKAVGAS